MDLENGWRTCRIGGFWQWMLIVGSLLLLLFGFLILGSISDYKAEREAVPIGRPDFLFIPAVSFFFATYGLIQARRVRLRWNDEVVQDKSKFFEFREYRWKDLTDVQPTFDGVGRTLFFDHRGRIDMRPNSGKCAIPLRDIWKIEAFAREKLKENARTS